jgi:hypothetical protein
VTAGDIETLLAYERHFRSQIVALAVELEELVDDILAWTFGLAEERHHLLFGLLREGEVGLSKKLRVLKKLLTVTHPDVAADCGVWIKRIDRLRVLRNKFAHGRFILPDERYALPLPQNADGVQVRWRKADGSPTTEFVSRMTVDAHVNEGQRLVFMGGVLRVLVRSRLETPGADEGALLDLLANGRRRLERKKDGAA